MCQLEIKSDQLSQSALDTLAFFRELRGVESEKETPNTTWVTPQNGSIVKVVRDSACHGRSGTSFTVQPMWSSMNDGPAIWDGSMYIPLTDLEQA